MPPTKARKPTYCPRPTRTRTPAATPPRNARSASREEIAELLGVTPARVSQMVTAGTIARTNDGGIDPVAALRAALAAARADDPGRTARARAIRSRAIGAELRARRELRTLITADELEGIVDEMLESGRDMIQRETSNFHATLSARMPDAEATRAAWAVHRAALGWVRGIDNGARALLEEIRSEVLPDDARLADVFRNLLAGAQRAAAEADALNADDDEI